LERTEASSLIAQQVKDFQAIAGARAYVLDGYSVLRRKFGSAIDPSCSSEVVDANVADFQALNPPQDPCVVYVLGSDTKLWREFGNLNDRQFVDAKVAAFQPLDPNIVFVLGSDSKLWREVGNLNDRSFVDGNVKAFHTLDGAYIFVLGTDGKLWREAGGLSSKTEVDANVAAFQPIGPGYDYYVYVLGSDGKLWLERLDYPPQ
jgi:hypothetical protein